MSPEEASSLATQILEICYDEKAGQLLIDILDQFRLKINRELAGITNLQVAFSDRDVRLEARALLQMEAELRLILEEMVEPPEGAVGGAV